MPDRVRPTVLAFGGVADGFVPFDTGADGTKHELKLASIVMKAVQVNRL